MRPALFVNMRFYALVFREGRIEMRMNSCLVALALTLSFTSSPSFAKEDSSQGRAGNWQKSAQGAPDLKGCAKRAESNPKNAEAQNDYGWALRQNGDLVKAEEYLRKATEIDPALPYVHSNLSVVLLDQGKKDESLKKKKKVIA